MSLKKKLHLKLYPGKCNKWYNLSSEYVTNEIVYPATWQVMTGAPQGILEPKAMFKLRHFIYLNSINIIIFI